MFDPEAFERDGYCAPFRAIANGRMRERLPAIDEALATPGPDSRSRAQSRHLDSAVVREICEAPSILERVHQVLVPSIVLWRSNFFLKEPGDPPAAWHRDLESWGSLLTPMKNVSAWIAIENVTLRSGCLEVRPRSDEGREDGIAMELSSGECFLFDEALLHRARGNDTSQRRLGLAVRFTLPNVTVDLTRLFPGYRPIRIDAPV